MTLDTIQEDVDHLFLSDKSKKYDWQPSKKTIDVLSNLGSKMVEDETDFNVVASGFKIAEREFDYPKRILSELNGIEKKVNTIISKTRLDKKHKYALIASATYTLPTLGSNWCATRIHTPRMGLPVDFVWQSQSKGCKILNRAKLTLKYKIVKTT